jgi:hypothetical protein
MMMMMIEQAFALRIALGVRLDVIPYLGYALLREMKSMPTSLTKSGASLCSLLFVFPQPSRLASTAAAKIGWPNFSSI